MTGIPAALEQALRDRYRLERELGRGGMATVYLATDQKHERHGLCALLRPSRLSAGIGGVSRRAGAAA